MRLTGRRETAARIEAIAANWILRRDAGFTAGEEAEFQRWQAQDPRHAEAVTRKGEAWASLDMPPGSRQTAWLVAHLEARARKRRRARTAVAGAMALVAAVAVWQLEPRRAMPADPHGVVILPERRTLPDGSSIELRPGAEVRTEFNGTVRRMMIVRGEAHFEVATDPARPFVVRAGAVEVRAVGTAFSVQWESERVDVLVTEGRVAVERRPPEPAGPGARFGAGGRDELVDTASSAGPAGAGEAGPIATVDAGRRLVVDLQAQASAAPPVPVAVSPREMNERLAWREPRLEFSELPLRDAVALLNRYNAAQFVIDDPAIARLPVSGVFRAHNIDGFVRLLKAACGVEADRAGETIRLRRARG